MIRLITTLSAMGLMLSALPVSAQGISANVVAPPRSENGSCPGDKKYFSDSPLAIRGAGTKQIELFGWFIDTVKTASIEGLPGASVQIITTRGGPANVLANCGSNGSIVLSLTLPAVSEVKRPKLKLDGLRIPLEVFPWAQGHDLVWRTDNAATGQEESDTERRARYFEYERQKREDQERCVEDNISNSNARHQCALLYRPRPIEEVYPDKNTLRNQLFTRCAAPHGLKAELYKNVLTVTLPPNREDIGRCAQFPIVASYAQYTNSALNLSLNPHVEMQGFPTIGPDTQEGPLPNATTLATYQIFPPERGRNIGLSRATVETLVGSVRQSYRTTGLEGGDTIVLIVKSEPDYAVKTTNPPFMHQGVGRLGSTIDIAVEPVQPTETGQVFEWNATGSPQGVSVSTCLQTVSGTVTPPAGQTRFIVPLRLKEEPRCYGKVFSVAIGPRGLSGNATFGRSTPFTIHAPAQVRNPGNLIDDRVKIQGSPPLIRP